MKSAFYLRCARWRLIFIFSAGVNRGYWRFFFKNGINSSSATASRAALYNTLEMWTISRFPNSKITFQRGIGATAPPAAMAIQAECFITSPRDDRILA